MNDFNSVCPHCQRAVTISSSRHTRSRHDLHTQNTLGSVCVWTAFTVCPNPKCQKLSLDVSFHKLKNDLGTWKSGEPIKAWRLVPDSSSVVFPEYVPTPIRDDYKEAALIKELSPKASATLSRRCLQGIIRDFWKVKPGRLIDEIRAIEDRVDPVTWGAIDAVRKIGNVGAHMEKDINVIVDVDAGEADLLISLVETLISEWYVATEERRVRMEAITAAAVGK